MPGLGGGSCKRLGSQSSQDACGRAYKVTWAKIWARPAGPDHQGQSIDGVGARDALASSGPSEWVPVDVTAGANS